MAGLTATHCLNILAGIVPKGSFLAGTHWRTETGAANVWAGTSGMTLEGALNVEAGTNTPGNYRTATGAVNVIAGTTGKTYTEALNLLVDALP